MQTASTGQRESCTTSSSRNMTSGEVSCTSWPIRRVTVAGSWFTVVSPPPHPAPKTPRLTIEATETRITASFPPLPRQQLPPELLELPPHRSVQQALADPDHRAAQDLRLDREPRDDLLPQRLGQGFGDALLQRGIRLPRQGDPGADPVEFHVEERAVLRGDFAEEQLPAPLDDGVQKVPELLRCLGHAVG